MSDRPLTSPHRSSGIYALVDLDGAPLAARDLRTLDLASKQGAGWQIEALDRQMAAAADRLTTDHGVIGIVGEIAARSDLAERLGLPRDAPLAVLAARALDRFGTDTPREMLGEWSLARFDCRRGLTLMQGATHRDRLFYATAGPRVAAASNLFALAGLDWVDDGIDDAGFLHLLGSGPVRRARGQATMLRGVRQVLPGSTVTVGLDGSIRHAQVSALDPQPRWNGSFADAVAESETLLRTIVRERLEPDAQAALMLSGGLDSSLLAWLVAEEKAAGRVVPALTSIAPPGSGLADEAAFAGLVADTLAMPWASLYPPPDANIYRPVDPILTGASGPSLNNRHCLTAAAHAVARRHGAARLIEGAFGEQTMTVRLTDPSPSARLRRIAGRAYRGLRQIGSRENPADAFHVRLARSRLAHLPEPIAAAIRLPPLADPKRDRHGLLGYSSGASKALGQTTEMHPGALRAILPYRDVRLLRLFASFPVEILAQGGNDRALARRMLEGRLPDSIRLRTRGLPASPDHLARLRRQANDARSRIAAFRKADVDEWLDLDWLDERLGAVAARGPAGVSEANTVQVTAMVAEFLAWWRGRS